jgi:hypothetical protein
MSLPKEERRGLVTEVPSIPAAAVTAILRGQIMTDLWTSRRLEGVVRRMVNSNTGGS